MLYKKFQITIFYLMLITKDRRSKNSDRKGCLRIFIIDKFYLNFNFFFIMQWLLPKLHKVSFMQYDIWGAGDKEFDEYTFCDGKRPVRVEGKLWKREYGLKNEGKHASGLQIIRNYSNAIKNMGGTILFEGTRKELERVCPEGEDEQYARRVNGRVAKGGKETL
jgi:hypothetical protein